MTVGQLLRRKRTAAQLTQEAAASRSDVSARSWNRTENDRFSPSPSLLARMASVVGVTPEDLENVGEDAAADVLRSLHEKPSGTDDDLIRRLFAELGAAIPAGYSIRTWHGLNGTHGVEVSPLSGAQPDREAGHDQAWRARRASGE